jgi:hypothetical protein
VDRVRVSCGYLAGLWLHEQLGEPLCETCTLARELLKPAADPEAGAHRDELEAAIGAGRTTRTREFSQERGYNFPGILD